MNDISAIGSNTVRSDQPHVGMRRKLDCESSCSPLIILMCLSDQASSGGEVENRMILIVVCRLGNVVLLIAFWRVLGRIVLLIKFRVYYQAFALLLPLPSGNGTAVEAKGLMVSLGFYLPHLLGNYTCSIKDVTL